MHSDFRWIFHQIFNNLFFWIERPEVIEAHGFDGYLHDLLVGDAKGSLLFLKIVFPGIHQHALRNQADYLCASYFQTSGTSCPTDFLVGDVKGSGFYVGDIHRDLGDAVFVDVPSDCLATFERPRDPDLVPVGVFK